MKKDGKNVELSEREQDTVNRVDSLRVVLKISKADAAVEALDLHKGTPSKEFVEWLTKGKFTKVDGQITKVEVLPASSEAA